ncbi:MAG: hypothetical protein ACO3QC_02335 [Phycisphaerales bacterium]
MPSIPKIILAARRRLRRIMRPGRAGPWTDGSMHPESCRYDTFARAAVPNIREVGPLVRAHAPSYFTYASHSAMFVGFTPGDASRTESIVNPKYGKLVRLDGGGTKSRGNDRFLLRGRNIVDGFNRAGHVTAGTGAVRWFDDSKPTSQHLTRDFRHFLYAGNTWSLARQVAWLASVVGGERRPVFAFLNVGETHTPYWHEGAAWSPKDEPCKPFSPANDAEKSRERQLACLEFADRTLAPVLRAFANANIMVCGDHGDAWGEDGLWEHGFHHPTVLEVPLLFRTSPRPA